MAPCSTLPTSLPILSFTVVQVTSFLIYVFILPALTAPPHTTILGRGIRPNGVNYPKSDFLKCFRLQRTGDVRLEDRQG